MKISAELGMWSALVFALFCLYIAFDGFISLASITDETRRADGRGFAFFWLFLGGVSIACALLSRWIIKREEANPSDG